MTCCGVALQTLSNSLKEAHNLAESTDSREEELCSIQRHLFWTHNMSLILSQGLPIQHRREGQTACAKPALQTC